MLAEVLRLDRHLLHLEATFQTTFPLPSTLSVSTVALQGHAASLNNHRGYMQFPLSVLNLSSLQPLTGIYGASKAKIIF